MQLRLGEFKQFLADYLFESRLTNTQAKYPNVDVEKLSLNDPSGNDKYLQWMAKQIDLGASENDLFPTVNYFHKNIQRFKNKDINSYKKLKDLEDLIKSAPEKKTSRERKESSKSGGQKIGDDNDYNLIYIGDKASCQAYGSGTKWCITSKHALYYEQYTGANVVFYFLMRKQLKNDPLDKVALAVQRNQNNDIIRDKLEFFDSLDKSLQQSELALKIPGFDVFVAEALADAPKRPKGFLAKINDGEASEKDEFEFVKLYKDDQKMVGKYISKFKNQKFLLDFYQKYHNNKIILRSITINPNTPTKIIDQLVNHNDSIISSNAFSNPNISSKLLTNYSIKNNDINSLIGFAGNPNISMKQIKTLANHTNKRVRVKIARNLSTPPQLIKKLLEDDVHKVRFSAIKNLNIPSELLTKYSINKLREFPIAVAQHTKTPLATLKMLAKTSNDYVVCKNLLDNPNTPESMIPILKEKIKPGPGYDDEFY